MRWFSIIVMIYLAAGCSSGGGSFKTNTDFNPEINFTTYQSFSWVSERPFMGGTTEISALNRQRIQDSIFHILIARGYSFTKDPMEADFVVSYTVGKRQKIQVNSYPVYYGRGMTRGWGRYYWGGYSGTETRVTEYNEGQLAIDIFDVKTKQPAWHGNATKRISTKDQREIQITIQNAVTQILNGFPPDLNR